MKKILLLGSGELGKELVIALQRLGQHIIACDNYPGAPAMQVADEHEVFDMLDGEALRAVVDKHRPDLIVPEVESIRTDLFYTFEEEGYTVIPSAKAANFTMNRKLIRDLAAQELGLRTAAYRYADNRADFESAVNEIGLPCVVKPLMSSSGKGQSVLRSMEDLDTVWEYALAGSRGDLMEVIVEEFVDFHTEITLLTVTQSEGPVRFCPAIGHRQAGGDYQESWQPCPLSEEDLQDAQRMAEAVTTALGGPGIWGIEFFIANDGVYFSELSPRPHDTGMVTMAGTQMLNEFELHARAILGLPVHEVTLSQPGVSAVVLADATSEAKPSFKGVDEVLKNENAEVRLFGKPSTRPGRRMGVVLLRGDARGDMEQLRAEAARLAQLIQVT